MIMEILETLLVADVVVFFVTLLLCKAIYDPKDRLVIVLLISIGLGLLLCGIRGICSIWGLE